jgi:hypothetical protein
MADERPIFVPEGEYLLASRRWKVLAGPCPVESKLPRGADFIGQTWVVNGKPRKVSKLETHALGRPLRVGDNIGVVFE